MAILPTAKRLCRNDQWTHFLERGFFHGYYIFISRSSFEVYVAIFNDGKISCLAQCHDYDSELYAILEDTLSD